MTDIATQINDMLWLYHYQQQQQEYNNYNNIHHSNIIYINAH